MGARIIWGNGEEMWRVAVVINIELANDSTAKQFEHINRINGRDIHFKLKYRKRTSNFPNDLRVIRFIAVFTVKHIDTPKHVECNYRAIKRILFTCIHTSIHTH